MTNNAIVVEDLSFTYKKKKALQGLSCEVQQGEIFGFLGPNGAGKSTTQKILTGIIRNYQGTAQVLGQEMRKVSVDFYNDIGVLFEFPYLYNTLSGYDNLKYFSSYYNKPVQDICEVLEHLGFKMDFIKKPVSSYSKGMKQRINMARALITQPKLLFLDEPTSGLDPAGAVLFREVIQEQREKGVTVFLTTHSMYDAELLCDRVGFLVDGTLHLVGTIKGIKDQYGEKSLEEIFIETTGSKLPKKERIIT